MIKTKEFRLISNNIDEKINEFISKNNIKQSNLIDIKYTAKNHYSFALLIYMDGYI